MYWAWRMQLATGAAHYADVLERVLYNGFLAGVALDGGRYFYVNPLQVRADTTLGPDGRQEWFSCACCPPNVMRTTKVLLDGTEIQVREADYVHLTRTWTGGEAIELAFPMRPRLTLADPRVDDARGCVAIERGPLVYCVEHMDQDAVLDGLTLSGQAREGAEIEISGTTLPIVLVDATLESFERTDKWPYWELDLESGGAEAEAAAEPELERTTLTAIPYFAWANRKYGAMRVWLPHEQAV
jgi:DUF1680 family protein